MLFEHYKLKLWASHIFGTSKELHTIQNSLIPTVIAKEGTRKERVVLVANFADEI